jgi:hypothetical protein
VVLPELVPGVYRLQSFGLVGRALHCGRCATVQRGCERCTAEPTRTRALRLGVNIDQPIVMAGPVSLQEGGYRDQNDPAMSIMWCLVE